ncbi:deoxyribodipyrimidine photo-lyase family protein (cryptochrome) [Tamilnaduibacter salinus]|uniref:Deoxyribodipyrimidine photo-lyase family protein (Cryptochrome) n=1 Tax=Tamilnaduibacter salinus TaxID=1484056 RepID=A0A2U1CVW1_9GAMM|nr:deoxyribodipyrimidine photo-lyase [Tamilnaduibacter salinus]PVY75853.1 deoxyribodipyrimidine photo-lyase family protein (cryptochrome) [Tamilnaduibacter salinus]
MTTVVWFKRDLRVDDHPPLHHAVASGRDVLPLYVIEPAYWQLPDTSERQWAFVRESLVELDHRLRERGSALIVRVGRVTDVLSELRSRFDVDTVLAHQETGNDWTFQRDRDVLAWCRDQSVTFREWRPYGVVRRLPDRDLWDREWQRIMRAEPVPAPSSIPALPDGLDTNWPGEPTLADRRSCPGRQPGGDRAARKLLDTFLERRCVGYQHNISSPNTATHGSSRLSPHLAHGTISLRRVYQAAKMAGADRRALPRKQRSLTSFRSRLHWHCHFIQKLEDEPELEFRAIHREMEHLKSGPNDPERLERWREGQTGWPLVDASMRALHATGWINFRMRAMLMAVANYHLWLHWREPALHLARQFTDFEPGIHYPQAQMQSGLTGINALRIYNPVLQSQKLDADGRFIRQWIPELTDVPCEWIHQPWLMSADQQARFGVGTYPQPICDHEEASRTARRAVREFRRQHVSEAETNRVLDRHGSRKGPPQKRPKPPRENAGDDQMTLF